MHEIHYTKLNILYWPVIFYKKIRIFFELSKTNPHAYFNGSMDYGNNQSKLETKLFQLQYINKRKLE